MPFRIRVLLLQARSRFFLQAMPCSGDDVPQGMRPALRRFPFSGSLFSEGLFLNKKQ